MAYTYENQSIHCYKGTDILINKFNIRNQNVLDKIDADITRKNIAYLNMYPIKGNFDLIHLQNIHSAIFKDIYPFAGRIRDEIISKGTTFALPQYINSSSNELFKNLKNENYLLNKNIDEITNRLSYYMSEINAIHPFREGNGRSNREFIRTLGAKCGFYIDWSRLSKEDLLSASIRAMYNTDNLEKLMRAAIVNDVSYVKRLPKK